jgi:1-deoxy-D-xylulose-5-phosphate reductoisomerase
MTTTPVKRIAIFGSTGSIGKQALEVIAANKDKFSVEILTANNNEEVLIEQALLYQPNIVVIAEDTKYAAVKEALSKTNIKVFAGEKALEEVAAMDCYDLMLAAIVGYAGLKPTLQAICAGKTIALANKETLVVAGDIVMQKAVEKEFLLFLLILSIQPYFNALWVKCAIQSRKLSLLRLAVPFSAESLTI